MSGGFPRLALLAAVALAMAAPPVPGARGTWYDPYLDGLEALEKGDAARAVGLFETALSRRAESGYHRTYGTNFIAYTPHAHLALALKAVGDCRRALSEIERARAAGEPEIDPSLGPRLAGVRRDCTPDPPPARAAGDAVRPAAPPAPVESAPEPPRLDPASIERGLVSYFAGDLGTAERVFGDLVEAAPDSAVARLLLATVRFARWNAGGRRDEALARAVRESLARARALDPRLEPPRALCPPELIARWQALR